QCAWWEAPCLSGHPMVPSHSNKVKSNYSHVKYRNVILSAIFGSEGTMLNPRQVEAFRAVMTTGSVTLAATTMHVTQPAVSRLIRDLERALKLVLFERRG